MPKAKKTKLSNTVVTFLLDRSGSMQMIKAATIEGFNAYLATLKAEKETAIDFTFLTFDTGSLDKVYVAKPIKTVPELTDSFYQPRGGTPLVDAAVKTIRATEEALKDKKTRVVVAIQTDGQENASVEHTSEELRGLIEEKTKAGWEFLFMGAGVDAYSQASQYGIAMVNAMSYNAADLGQTRAAFSATASNTANFGSMRSQNASYTAQNRQEAGDQFYQGAILPGGPPSPPKAPPAKRKTVPDVSL